MCFVNLHEVLQAAIVCSPLLAERSGQRVVLETLEGWKFFLSYRMGFSKLPMEIKQTHHSYRHVLLTKYLLLFSFSGRNVGVKQPGDV